MKCPELKGGFSACLCPGTIAGEPRSLILGLVGWMLLDIGLLQASCVDNIPVYVRRKAFLQYFVFLLPMGQRGTVCSGFTPCLKRQHKWMGHG